MFAYYERTYIRIIACFPLLISPWLITPITKHPPEEDEVQKKKGLKIPIIFFPSYLHLFIGFFTRNPFLTLLFSQVVVFL